MRGKQQLADGRVKKPGFSEKPDANQLDWTDWRRASVSESSLQRRELLYTGNVQGVGFRYTARRIAQGYRVAGFVRNLRDGRVQIAVEGQAEEIDAFLSDLLARMGQYIRDVTDDQMRPTGEFSGFEIRF